MATLYAWSDIRVGAPSEKDTPGKTTVVKYGEAVTADKLGGADKAQMNEYISGGVLRETKPPKLPDGWQGSPLDYVRMKAAESEETSDMLPSTGGSLFAPTNDEILLGEANVTS